MRQSHINTILLNRPPVLHQNAKKGKKDQLGPESFLYFAGLVPRTEKIYNRVVTNKNNKINANKNKLSIHLPPNARYQKRPSNKREIFDISKRDTRTPTTSIQITQTKMCARDKIKKENDVHAGQNIRTAECSCAT